MSRQADFSRVIWSAMVSEVNPGSRFANSTILMMHFVESSLNLSHKPRSSWTRWSELEFWKHTGGFVRLLRWRAGPFASELREPVPRNAISILHQSRLQDPFVCCINHSGAQMARWRAKLKVC